jgi:phosphomannomutase
VTSEPTAETTPRPELSTVLDTIVKAYDIRGVYPGQISADVVARLGQGFAAFIARVEPDTTAVAIGRDMRPSGPELVDAFAHGVMAHGLDVIDIGLASTDMLYFASGSLGVPGVMFTASHNPAEYNGIKLCRSGAAPVGEDSGLADIKQVAIEGGPEPAARAGSRSTRNLLDDFSRHVRSFIFTDGLRPLKVVADTANGMGGLVVPEVFKELPFELEVLYPELDGTFPNHEANPIEAKNLVDLQARVLETGADIGLAFDGDADRVFLVDEEARPVSGSLTTALLATSILASNPGAKVIYNLICSKAVPEVISEAGGVAVRSRVGHSFIKETMARENAVFGGEHSAHYYFQDNWRADSGLIASVMVLEQLGRYDGPLSELLAPLDRYAASGEINTRVSDAAGVIDHVARHFASTYDHAVSDRLDGLTIDLGDWWFNLRPSNTEPLLRLNLEAPDETSVAAGVAEVQSVMAAAS